MTKTFVSLLIAYLLSIIAGFISILITLLLFNNFNGENIAFVLIGWLIYILFISVISSITLFLPIAIIDKKKIQENSFTNLMSRYLPIITLPLSSLLSLTFFYTIIGSSTREAFTTMILSAFSASFVGLWAFIKKIKS